MKATVNAKGQKCPVPLIMTRDALSKAEPGDTLIIEIDNPTSRQNVERFLKDNNASVSVSEKEGLFVLTAVKMEENLKRPDAEAYCPTSHVVLFRNNLMGTGPEELGAILMQAFVNTLSKVEPIPSALLFYNNGIHLAVEGSPVLPALQELEKKGVSLLVCGTCLDYFKSKGRLRASRVSNMYEILEKLTLAGHVIEP